MIDPVTLGDRHEPIGRTSTTSFDAAWSRLKAKWDQDQLEFRAWFNATTSRMIIAIAAMFEPHRALLARIEALEAVHQSICKLEAKVLAPKRRASKTTRRRRATKTTRRRRAS